MFSSNADNDSDSIDFDFFENDVSIVNTCLNSSINKNNSSKIVTRAVIETNSRHIDKSHPSEEIADVNLKPSKDFEFDLDSHDKIFQQSVSTRGCSGESFFNSLAYDKSIRKQGSFSICLDDIDDVTDDLTSDSTITTISSDLTSVSSFSFTSDSSLASDLSLDSPARESDDTRLNELLNHNFNDASTQTNNNDTGKLDTSKCQANRLSEQVKNETNKDGGLNYISVKPDIMNKSKTLNSDDRKPNDKFEYYDCSIATNDFFKLNRPIITESIICSTEEEFKKLSFSTGSSSTPVSVSTPSIRESSKLQLKKRKFNLTFSREELIKIERDNLTLLKKIMAHSKPRTVMYNNHTFSHKKASAAINRAKLQKQIEQDNYILYSKINAMSRMKNVC